MARAKRDKYEGWTPAPIVGGSCTKHREKTTPSNICMSCHHDALDAAGFDWRTIGSMRPMGNATGFNMARLG